MCHSRMHNNNFFVSTQGERGWCGQYLNRPEAPPTIAKSMWPDCKSWTASFSATSEEEQAAVSRKRSIVISHWLFACSFRHTHGTCAFLHTSFPTIL